MKRNHRRVDLPAPVTSWTSDQVTALIRNRFDASVDHTRRVGSGAWSDCFAFTSGEREFVVRVGRFGQDFLVDQFVGRETVGLLPVPETVHVAPIDTEFFAISDFVPGQPLESIESWSHMVPAIANLLESLRTTDLDHVPGWGRWNPNTGAEATSWRSFLLAVGLDPQGSRMHGWRAKLAMSTVASDAFARGYRWLENSIVDRVPRSLVHNDLLNRNVHVTGSSITGVFDWGNSLLGDHLYDLALFCFWEPWLSNVHAQPVVDAVRSHWRSQDDVMANFDDRLRSCLLHIALEHIAYHSRLEQWAEVDRIIERMDETGAPKGAAIAW